MPPRPVYVDNHAKEVWSTLFTQAGKVSHRTRVMPCITTTYAHTGAGTPLVMSVQSGSAPLAPRLVDLVDNAEATLGNMVNRAVDIDSKSSTFDILAAFDAGDRVIVTPLKPSRAPELELVYSRGSYSRSPGQSAAIFGAGAGALLGVTGEACFGGSAGTLRAGAGIAIAGPTAPTLSCHASTAAWVSVV